MKDIQKTAVTPSDKEPSRADTILAPAPQGKQVRKAKMTKREEEKNSGMENIERGHKSDADFDKYVKSLEGPSDGASDADDEMDDSNHLSSAARRQKREQMKRDRELAKIERVKNGKVGREGGKNKGHQELRTRGFRKTSRGDGNESTFVSPVEEKAIKGQAASLKNPFELLTVEGDE
jgi:hypothetical protein